MGSQEIEAGVWDPGQAGSVSWWRLCLAIVHVHRSSIKGNGAVSVLGSNLWSKEPGRNDDR